MSGKLTIYFTSDTHGYLLPTDFIHPGERAVGLLSMDFPRDGDTLVLDGGDSLQGSPLTYWKHAAGEPSPVAEAFNRVGYDVVTLGNHDFNYGYDALKAHLEALDAECVCANVRDVTGRLPIVPWTVRTMKSGLRVGILGLVTDWIKLWEQPEHLVNFEIESPLEAAKRYYPEVRAASDVVVGLYHGGYERDLDTGERLSNTDENVACALCEAAPFDLLLTGHQHIALAGKAWRGVPMAQTPSNAARFVKAIYDGKGWTTALCAPARPAALKPPFDQMRDEMERWLDTPIGHLSRPIWPEDKLTMALEGSPIADFFNRVQLDASGADISCTALANDIRGFDADVTVRDVVASYVYSNTLVVLRVTGRVLRAALEQCASYFEVGEDGAIAVSRPFVQPKEAHYNYDYFYGMTYAFDLRRPVGDRVTEMRRNGADIGPEDELNLVMCNYRATGAGDFECYLDCPKVKEDATEISELILNYLAAHPRIEISEAHPIRCVLPETGAKGV